MTEIKWEAPPQSQRGKGAYNDFAKALRDRPGDWALLSEDTASATVTGVNRGTLSAFRPAGAFEARGSSVGRHRSKVWVRFVGAA